MAQIFGGLRLPDVTEQHLLQLVKEQVQETDSIEYKSLMYGQSDDEKKEMLKDISSLANHRGGYLIIGIEADEDGIATNVVGIEPNNHVERIRSSCLHNIDKRIMALEIEDVTLGSGKVVVIICVPESLNAPHMVTFKGLNQFWKRHGRQKDKMTVDEIGEAFERRLSGLNRLDRFLFTRRAEVLEIVGDQPFLVVSSVPVHLRDEAILDIHDNKLRNLITNPPSLVGISNISCGVPYPTINGLRADNRFPYENDNHVVHEYIEVFPNGYIEYGRRLRHLQSADLYFASVADTAHIVNFMRFIEELYGTYSPLLPLAVGLTIYNARGMWFAVSELPSEESKLVRWQKQHLELEKFYTENLAVERKLLTKRICDRLWQAFHYEKSNLFDDAGNFKRS